MSDVKIPDSIPCQFDAKGWAPCKKPSDNGWCTDHEGMKCWSCGNQAITSCDAGIGGLACGAPLCATCEHSTDGKHITKEVGEENRRNQREEKIARNASRTNPDRRINDHLNVPMTLFELLKGDWRSEGYEMKKIYFIELKHGLMGCFPAIFVSDKKRIVFTTDLKLLEKVWEKLPPRPAKLGQLTGYVNEETGIFYEDVESPLNEDEEPNRILLNTELDELLKSEEKPFKWASGLIGGGQLRKEDFFMQLTVQASKLDPSYTSAVA